MRKSIILSTCCILLLLVFSCEDHPEGDGVLAGNAFRMYGMNYSLSSGILWHEIPLNIVHPTTEVYQEIHGVGDTTRLIAPSAEVSDTITGKFIVSLYGEGITYDPDSRRALGKSNVVTFHISMENDELKLGTYRFDNANKANTFYGYSSIEYDFSKGTGSINPIGEGSLEIRKEGELYMIAFDCKSVSDQTIKGTYTGELRLVDNREVSLFEVKDVTLEGLSDSCFTYRYWKNPPDFLGYGYDKDAKVYCISSNGFVISPMEIGYNIPDKSIVDIAWLNYYKSNSRCCFETPMKMALYTIFNAKYHTKFVNDVASSGIAFTVEDFDKLTRADGHVFQTMKIEADHQDFPVDVALPRIVLFQNSKGIKGAIKIKEIEPIVMGDKKFYDEYTYQYVTKRTPVGGYVKFDMKIQQNSISEKIK